MKKHGKPDKAGRKAMKPRSPIRQTKNDHAAPVMLLGYGATVFSVSLGKWRLGAPDALDYIVLVVWPLIAAATVVILLRRRREFLEEPVSSSFQEAEARTEAHRYQIASSLWIYLGLWSTCASSAWRLLHNPALGAGYKAFIVVAVNIAAYALSQSLPIAATYYRDTRERLKQTEPSAWRRFILLLMPNAYDTVSLKPAAPVQTPGATPPAASVATTVAPAATPPAVLRAGNANRL